MGRRLILLLTALLALLATAPTAAPADPASHAQNCTPAFLSAAQHHAQALASESPCKHLGSAPGSAQIAVGCCVATRAGRDLPRLAGGAPRFATSRGARREAMRDAGLPTSVTPAGRIRSEFGDQYLYSVPKPGGGSRTLAVTNHASDSRHGPHWEVGVVRPGSRDTSGRFHYYNRDPLTGRAKSQAPYGDG